MSDWLKPEEREKYRERTNDLRKRLESLDKEDFYDGSARVKALEEELEALKQELDELKKWRETPPSRTNPLIDAAQETVHSIKDSVGGAMQHAKDGILGLFDNKKYVIENGIKFDEEDKKAGYRDYNKMTRDELLKARPHHDTSIFIESLEKGIMRVWNNREYLLKFAKGNRRLLGEMLDHYKSGEAFKESDVKRLAKKYNVKAQDIANFIHTTYLDKFSEGLPYSISD